MSNGKSPSLTWGGVLLAISVVTGQFVNLVVERLTADRVTLPATAEGALSATDQAVIRYDGDADQIVASVNGGAFGPLAGAKLDEENTWTAEQTFANQDVVVSDGNVKLQSGSLDLDADLRLGYLASGRGYLASTHAFNAEYRFLEFGDSEPADYVNISNTAGKDVYFKAQSGGAHTSGNPAGGSFIFEPGAKGAGGSGADGGLIVRQPGGVAGTDDLVLRHDGTDGSIRALSGSLHLLDNGGTSRLNITSGGSLRFSVTAQPNNSTVDLGASGNGFRGIHLKEDGSSGVYWGNDDDVRAWFDETTTDNFFITSSKGDFVLEPAGSDVIVRQPGGVAGTDEVRIYDDGTFSYVDGKNDRLRLLGNRIDLHTGTGGVNVQNTAFWPNTANTHDIGLTSLEFRSLILGEDSNSGVYWGLDQDVRAYFDEATTDNFILVSTKGDFVFEPGGGEVVIRQSGGVAGTDDLLLSHNGTNAVVRPLSGSTIIQDSSGSNRVLISSTGLDVVGVIAPTTANARDLGTAALEFRALYLGEDASSGIYLGLDQNGRLYFDEASTDDVILSSANSGENIQLAPASGGYVVLASIKTDTGDPTPIEGMIVLNTFDNTVKIYADGAWRTLASGW